LKRARSERLPSMSANYSAHLRARRVRSDRHCWRCPRGHGPDGRRLVPPASFAPGTSGSPSSCGSADGNAPRCPRLQQDPGGLFSLVAREGGSP
jgi:hypothetical protein